MINVTINFKEMKQCGCFLEEEKDVLTIRSSYGKKILEIIDRGENRKIVLTENDNDTIFFSGKIEIKFIGPISGIDHFIDGKYYMVTGEFIEVHISEKPDKLIIREDIFGIETL